MVGETHHYKYIYKPNHPFADKSGCIFEHRLVMERKLGRYLRPEEKVHHKNRIKDDNREENLQLFRSHGEHISFEQVGRKLSEETKKRIGIKSKGRWLGRKHTEDSKSKIREANLGKELSEDVKNKISKTKLIDMSQRICSLCGNAKTKIRSDNGRPHWFLLHDRFVCSNCYRKIRK